MSINCGGMPADETRSEMASPTPNNNPAPAVPRGVHLPKIMVRQTDKPFAAAHIFSQNSARVSNDRNAPARPARPPLIMTPI